jgi:SAM-dependent methyltransferase
VHALSPVELARRLVRRRRSPPAGPDPSADAVQFRCNVCGAHNRVDPARIARESTSCGRCLSTVRFRAMAYLAVRETLGIEAALPDLSPRRDISGIGLSDDRRYARRLARIFDYQNTYLHKSPRLDITDVPPARRGRYDFAIVSDVFEHVEPPVSRAFEGARSLLKPGGVLVFSVPFTLEAETVEHFPELCHWSLRKRDGAWRLTNVTADGRTETFHDLVFHGGPGSTLEMRRFSRAALERHFAAAGFARMRIADEPCTQFGIRWPEPWCVPMVAYAE